MCSSDLNDFGGSTGNWRAQQEKTTIFVWDYMTMDTFSSQAGMEIRISLDHDTAFGATTTNPSSAIATFYCVSEDV